MTDSSLRHRIALGAVLVGTMLLGMLVGRVAVAAPAECELAVATWGHRIYHDRRGAPWFTEPLALATCAAVHDEAAAVGVDPVLAVAVAAHESHFNPFAFRSTGERGPLQAKLYHCTDHLGHACRDVDDHVRGALRYLAAVIERAERRGWSWRQGLEAYKCGWDGATADTGWVPCRQYRDRIVARVLVLSNVQAPAAGAATQVRGAAVARWGR